ncbi:hypothetical protein [Nocardia sp. NPDC051570]|uniref:hypothetical protein n=1 Tax=Nocardia sp. NPDC051570 TaxID=3364324 RepID=UPI0037BD3531
MPKSALPRTIRPHAAPSRAHARILRTSSATDRRREIVTATEILDADCIRRRTFYLNRPEGDPHGSVSAIAQGVLGQAREQQAADHREARRPPRL